ncbi:unnamed protein product, partial [Ectocarpus sp. 13 AM-2016]
GGPQGVAWRCASTSMFARVVLTNVHEMRICGDRKVLCFMLGCVCDGDPPSALSGQACPAHLLTTKVLSQSFSADPNDKRPLPNTLLSGRTEHNSSCSSLRH